MSDELRNLIETFNCWLRYSFHKHVFGRQETFLYFCRYQFPFSKQWQVGLCRDLELDKIRESWYFIKEHQPEVFDRFYTDNLMIFNGEEIVHE